MFAGECSQSDSSEEPPQSAPDPTRPTHNQPHSGVFKMINLSSEPETIKVHKCESCGRRFSRREHLHRHWTGCQIRGKTKNFHCLFCNKAFTRKDVRSRHVRSLHRGIETPKSMSCLRCKSLNLSCTGGPPRCSICKDDHKKCQFEEPHQHSSLQIQPLAAAEGNLSEDLSCLADAVSQSISTGRKYLSIQSLIEPNDP